MELAQIEKDIGLYDVLGECKIQSEEFFKMANLFTNLWERLQIAEKKVRSSQPAQRRHLRQATGVRGATILGYRQDSPGTRRLRDHDFQDTAIP
jgi:hypothetical protein